MRNSDERSARVARDRANSNPELDSVRCEALRRSLGARLLACCFDELRVIDVELGRLEKGRDEHGFLDLSKPRDWDEEEFEELLDARMYRRFKKLQEHDAQVAAIDDRETDHDPRAPISMDDIDDRDLDAFFDDSDSDTPRDR